MRYRMFLLIGLLAAGTLGMVLPAPASYETNSYNLERTIIRGYVEAVEEQVAYIQTVDGDEVAVQLGPESYWNAHQYYLPEGQYVEILVWYDPSNLYTDWYFAREIWGFGFHYVLTNSDGVPYWVMYGDDYYYRLGYRASCVSYMFWYDCPPVYFIYLILPPPPPDNYFCYYGPRWRNHHNDWHHGPRYRRGGSYWQDGQGHERPGRRIGGQPPYNPGNNDDYIGGSNRAVTVPASYPRPVPPVTTPVVKPYPLKDQWQKQPAQTKPVNVQPRNDQFQRQPAKWQTMKSQPVENRKSVIPQKKYQNPTVAPVTTPERRVTVPKAAPQNRQVQMPVKEQPRKQVATPNVVRQAPRDNGKAQNIQKSNNSKSDKRVLADNQDQGLKKFKR